jgi:ribosomal protein L7Ae-like RNA K-turn-binding protein
MYEELFGSLGLAASAKKLVYGEMLFEMIREKKIRFVIITNDMSEKQKSNLINKCEHNNVPFKYLEDVDSLEFSKRIGKFNIKAVGISDSNFAKLIMQKF